MKEGATEAGAGERERGREGVRTREKGNEDEGSVQGREIGGGKTTPIVTAKNSDFTVFSKSVSTNDGWCRRGRCRCRHVLPIFPSVDHYCLRADMTSLCRSGSGKRKKPHI